jgi:2-iminobutanoate/2-iminopropanoate deaminase
MMKRIVSAVLTAALLAPVAVPAAGAQERDDIEYFRREGPRAPLSPAVRVGQYVFLSGMIGPRRDGTMPVGLEAQTRQMMENIRGSLALAGLGFEHVFRCTVMLDDMSGWPRFNQIYLEYFDPDRLPARSAFGADGLALGALVELECQAYSPDPRR